MLHSALLCILSYLFALVSAQEFLTVIDGQNELTTFTEYIKQYPDLVEQVNGGSYTVIAPSNSAFAKYATTSSTNSSDSGALKALLEYHLLRDVHASTSFSQGPIFAPTLLTNTSYANVTGGQRVELGTSRGTPALYSAAKAVSLVTKRDILFLGGLIQVVDTVLSIPLPLPQTITVAGLNNLIALLGKGGFLDPSAGTLDLVVDPTDFTAFAANDPSCGANYQGFNGLTAAQRLALFKYALVVGDVIYSPQLTNNSRFQSIQGEFLTITDTGDGIYVDDSKIAVTDYLISNGVLHTLHSVLSPTTAGARPEIITSPSPQPTSTNKALAPGTIAAIAIVGALLFLLGVWLFLFLLRRRRKSKSSNERRNSRRRDSQRLGEACELGTEGTKKELPAARTLVQELDGMNQRIERIELEARERPRAPPKSPRHIGFQVRAGVGLTI